MLVYLLLLTSCIFLLPSLSLSPFSMVPAKIVRDWKTLFIAGRPLYEESDGGSEGGDLPSPVASSTASCPSQQADSQQLLDDADLLEYRVSIFANIS